MTPPFTPADLLFSLERVRVDGLASDVVACRGLRCDARFVARPFDPARTEASVDDGAPFLEALLDLRQPETLLRARAAQWYVERGARQRFAVETHGEVERWYGFVTLGCPDPVELPTPHGVEIVAERDWASRGGLDDADLVVGADLLRRGALVFVGAHSDLGDGERDACCFFVPRYAPVRLR